MKKIIGTFLVGILVFSSFATVSEASARKSVFTDLSMKNTFYESIYSMYVKEVLDAEITMEGDVLINSSGIVTRADAAYMLYQLQGMAPENGKSFPDVSPDDWYYEAVSTVGAKGIVNGFEDGTFGPDKPLTRSQMSKIIALAFDYSIASTPNISFTDVNKTWAPYVQAMFDNGVTKGVTPTQFAPNKQLSRGEMAAFMDRAYKKVPGTSYNDFEVMNVVNEATRKARNVALQGLETYHPNQQVKDIRDDMSAIAVEPYLTQALNNYKNSCYACDVASVQDDYNFGLPYTIKALSNSSIIVDAVVPTTAIIEGYRGTIELVKIGDYWKIKSFQSRSFKVDPLNLTIEQATDYLLFPLPVYWNEEVQTIQHIGKHSITGDNQFLVNGKITYLFNVNTGELSQP